MDRGAWWATVHRVAKSRTRLKRLGRHTRPSTCVLVRLPSGLTYSLHVVLLPAAFLPQQRAECGTSCSVMAEPTCAQSLKNRMTLHRRLCSSESLCFFVKLSGNDLNRFRNIF